MIVTVRVLAALVNIGKIASKKNTAKWAILSPPLTSWSGVRPRGITDISRNAAIPEVQIIRETRRGIILSIGDHLLSGVLLSHLRYYLKDDETIYLY